MEPVTFRNAVRDEAVHVLEDPREQGTDGLLLAPMPSGHPSRPAQRAEEAAGTGDRPGDPDAPPRGSQDELVTIRDMVARLSAAHPLVDAVTVEATVRAACDSFRQARVRVYIPILVERRSRKALDAAYRAPPGRGPDAAGPPEEAGP